MKHTPTPYQIGTRLGYNASVIYSVNGDSEDEAICQVYGVPEHFKVNQVDERDLVNSEFIVRACNAYDDMLDALEAWMRFVYSPLFNDSSASIDAIHKTRTAIAKAKGTA